MSNQDVGNKCEDLLEAHFKQTGCLVYKKGRGWGARKDILGAFDLVVMGEGGTWFIQSTYGDGKYARRKKIAALRSKLDPRCHYQIYIGFTQPNGKIQFRVEDYDIAKNEFTMSGVTVW